MRNLWLIKATIYTLGVEVSHTLVDLVQRKVKIATPVKRWDTSQKCVEANPNQIQVKTINRITFAKKKIFLQSKHLHNRRWECFVLKNKSSACLRHGNISQ